jgi:flagellar biosynthetic protein FliO
MFTASQTSTPAWQSYGIFMLETLAALFVVALAAWALARFGGSWFNRGKGNGRLRVVERLGLDPKRAIYLVEVDKEQLLIGVSDGSVRLLKALGQPGEGEVKGEQ